MAISEKGSLKGYKLSIWWNKNKDTIKTLLASGCAIAVFFLPQIPDVTTSAGAAVLSGAVVKLLIDTVDFWLSDVEIKK